MDAVNLVLNATTTNFTSLVNNSGGFITCDGIDGGLPCYACPIITGDGMLRAYDFDVHPYICTHIYTYIHNISIVGSLMYMPLYYSRMTNY